jgi:hypothetical protein
MTSYRLAAIAAVTGACTTLSLVAYMAERDLEATEVAEPAAPRVEKAVGCQVPGDVQRGR